MSELRATAHPRDTMGRDAFPLTPVQEEILHQSLRQPLGAGVYLSHLILRLGGVVDDRVLLRAGQRVQARHDSLRTAFDWSGEGEPVQTVFQEAPLPFISEDWREVPEGERKGRLRGFLIADRFNGFDLTKAPLIRMALVRYGPAECRLVLTFHQIILDNRSAAVVLKEILECCQALRRNGEWSPPPAPGFGDFVLWLRGRRGAEVESFWGEYLKGFTSPTPVPPPLPPEQTGGWEKRNEPGDTVTAAQERRVLDRAATGALNRLAEELELSPRILLAGAWALMLGRHSGQDEVLFAVIESIHRLAPPELVGVGNHLGTAPLRVGLKPEGRLDRWLTELALNHSGLSSNQAASLSHIRSLSSIPGDEPLFETYLSFEEETTGASLGPAGWDGDGLEASWETRTPVPLLLSASLGEKLVLELEYDRRRYGEEAAARMIDQVETTLRSMARNPRVRLKNLNGLTGAEAQRLFNEWQPPPPPELTEARIHGLFQEAAARNPEALAVRHGEERISYGRLEEEANRWAHYLRSLGVGPETLVGLALERSIDQIVVLLAVLKAGGAYLPLDPDYPPDRLNYMIRDSGAELVVASARMENLAGLGAGRVIILEAAAEKVRELPPDPPPCRVSGENLAYLIYTSGSTGLPKGVMVEHRALAHYILLSCLPYGIKPEDRCLQFASASFDTATEEIFTALLNGAALVLRTREMSTSVKAFCGACQEWRLTVLDLPTAFWHLLAEELEPGELPPQVRMAVIGGEEALPDKLALWQSKVGPKVVLYNCYGPTEATIGATLADLTRERAGEHLPIGRPMKAVRAYVLGRDLTPVPQGAPGELFLAGPQLARGYLNRSELTAERFPVLNPAPPEFRGSDLDLGEIRLYRTGDRVLHRSDGQLLYLDRYDRQVQIRGFRVELGEVEAVLSGHPGVKTALAHARGDGSGEKSLAGYILPRKVESRERLRAELEELLAAGLPGHMRPSVLIFIDRVPLTGAGKVDYAALPGPETGSRQTPARRPGPDNRLEEELTALWEEVLGVKGIGAGDNFFDLGGHSLLAVKLISRIEKILGRSVHPLRLFQNPTVAGLARVLRREDQGTALGCLETFRGEGERPPLFFIGSSLLAPNLAPYLGDSQPFYGLNIFGLQGRDGAAPFHSLEEIAGHFIREIKRVRPSGPYRLAGYCADGDVGREMASQIIRAGEKVDFLSYVDAFWEEDHNRLGLKRHLANLDRFGRPYLCSKIRQKKRTLAARIKGRTARLEHAARRKLNLEIPLRLKTELFINRWFEALHGYRLRPYPGVTTIILADEWGGRVSQEGKRLAAGGYVLKETPGFHDNLFEEPQVSQLGRVLRECLEELDG